MTYDRKDSFYRKAKAEGLRSRAAFKLEDLDRRLLRRGDRVLDLGSWPGGWLQIAARRVGEQGRVIGVDLRKLDPIRLPQVRVIQGDVGNDAVIDELSRALEGPADVVLSDMSPQLTGIRDRDEARGVELVHLALAVAARVLRPGGGFVCKVFMNAEYSRTIEDVRARFDEVSTTRSEGTRRGSAELYVIARGRRGER